MDIQELLSVLFRWLHIGAGVLWIGLLYFFNFVNAGFAATLDGESKKKVVPELMPRALYFFRWAAIYTYVTGLLLLGMVFHGGGLMFDLGVSWSVGAYVMVAVALLPFGIYDGLAKSGLGKDIKTFGALGFVLVAVIVYLMSEWAAFSYRAYVIHIGVMFGSIMVANVWMRIWPAQKQIIAAVKEGTTPDAALVAQAGQRSRHNTYLSVPLFWTMINAHTTTIGPNGLFGLPHWVNLLIVIAIGWLLVSLVYDKAAKVKGF